MEDTCVFCKVVANELPASLVLETPSVVAFMDIDPVTPGHMLVVPRLHLPDLADLSDDLAAEMMVVAKKLASALCRSSLKSDGVNLFYADGEAAFQEVFHSHLHVFPRFPDDGFTIDARWGSERSRDLLNRDAAQVRDALS
jgi:histidine triad (HIT) family protein